MICPPNVSGQYEFDLDKALESYKKWYWLPVNLLLIPLWILLVPVCILEAVVEKITNKLAGNHH